MGFELSHQGWTVERLATLQDLAEDMLDLIDQVPRASELDIDLGTRDFRVLIDAAAGVATRSWRGERRRGEGDLLEAHMEAADRDRKRRRAEEVDITARRFRRLRGTPPRRGRR